MTRLNFTFQEASPLITYSNWVEGSSSNDTKSSSYNGSFRVAYTDSATASFTFTGTAVSLFGATRANHGQYSVSLDQQPSFFAMGATAEDAFNKSLWHADHLRYEEHQVVLTNLPVPQTDHIFLDLDYISIERHIGQENDEIFQNTLDDDSLDVEYVGAWSKTNKATANGGTLHMTSVAGSQAIITFNGCSLELYGHYANAEYSVTLDNQLPVNMAGFDIDPTPEFQHPRTLLYLVDGLSNGNHTVTLTNTKSNVNRPFFFDYAVISSTNNTVPDAPSGHSQPGSKPPEGSTTSPDGALRTANTPIAAIIGGVIGGVTFLALLILIFFLIRRRRRRAKRVHIDLIDESEVEPKPYFPQDHLQVQNTHPVTSPQTHTINPVPYIHPSKRHQMPTYYESLSPSSEGLITPREQSTEGLISPREQSSEGWITPREQPSEGASVSYGSAPPAGSGSGSRSAATRQGDTKSDESHSPTTSVESSQYPAVQEAENPQHPVVQEEDAGSVLSSEDRPKAIPVPPAYKQEWHHREDS